MSHIRVWDRARYLHTKRHTIHEGITACPRSLQRRVAWCRQAVHRGAAKVEQVREVALFVEVMESNEAVRRCYKPIGFISSLAPTERRLRCDSLWLWLPHVPKYPKSLIVIVRDKITCMYKHRSLRLKHDYVLTSRETLSLSISWQFLHRRLPTR